MLQINMAYCAEMFAQDPDMTQQAFVMLCTVKLCCGDVASLAQMSTESFQAVSSAESVTVGGGAVGAMVLLILCGSSGISFQRLVTSSLSAILLRTASICISMM